VKKWLDSNPDNRPEVNTECLDCEIVVEQKS